ncbi:hypothetical protein MASR2M17_17240 [Aminivibrio sp.]
MIAVAAIAEGRRERPEKIPERRQAVADEHTIGRPGGDTGMSGERGSEEAEGHSAEERSPR